MTSFLSGVLGALAVVVLLCTGAILGWKAHAFVWEHRAPEAAPQHTPTAEEIRRFKEDQEAFEAMLHYSPEMAYGVTGNALQDAARKET